jgi:hypothetical protein
MSCLIQTGDQSVLALTRSALASSITCLLDVNDHACLWLFTVRVDTCKVFAKVIEHGAMPSAISQRVSPVLTQKGLVRRQR